MGNWSKRTPIAVAVLVLSVPGCESPEPQVYDEVNWQGTVDGNLPREMQEKQDALIRLFTAIQEVAIQNVSEHEPDIRFEESFEQFFVDAVDLDRWDWDGPPEGDEFPVVLVLRKDEPGLPEVEHRRRYTVRRTGRRFIITRTE